MFHCLIIPKTPNIKEVLLHCFNLMLHWNKLKERISVKTPRSFFVHQITSFPSNNFRNKRTQQKYLNWGNAF